MGRRLMMTLALLLAVPGCMTHLRVTTSVWDGPLAADGIDVAGAQQRLGAIDDGVAEEAAAGFRRDVLPLSAAFDSLFSLSALDDETFGLFVELALRERTTPARAQVLRDLDALQAAVDEGSRVRAVHAWRAVRDGLASLEESVRTGLEGLVQQRARDDVDAIVSFYREQRPLLEALVAGVARGERASALGDRADRSQQDMEAPLGAEPAALVAAGRDQLACLWAFAFDVAPGEAAYTGDGVVLGDAVAALYDLADQARREGRGLTVERLDEALDELAELPDQVAARAGALEERLGQEVAETVAAQAPALLARLDLSDPSVAEVVGGDPRFWKRYVNEVDVWTVIGNSEIAVKMESLGQYKIKGVVVDNSAAVDATFDVLEMSVKTLAAAYGVPVGTKSDKKAEESAKEESKASDMLLSQPDLQAELASLEGRTEARVARLEQTFLELMAFAGGLPAAPDGSIPDSYIEDLVERRDALASTLTKRAQALREGR